jgi:hypothetical protein
MRVRNPAPGRMITRTLGSCFRPFLAPASRPAQSQDLVPGMGYDGKSHSQRDLVLGLGIYNAQRNECVRRSKEELWCPCAPVAPTSRYLGSLTKERFLGSARGHADDPQAAMPHARIRNDGRSALCEPAIPSRRFTRLVGRGILRNRSVNSAEPNFIWYSPVGSRPWRTRDTMQLDEVPQVSAGRF